VDPYNIPGTPDSGEMTEAVPPALSKGESGDGDFIRST